MIFPRWGNLISAGWGVKPLPERLRRQGHAFAPETAPSPWRMRVWAALLAKIRPLEDTTAFPNTGKNFGVADAWPRQALARKWPETGRQAMKFATIRTISLSFGIAALTMAAAHAASAAEVSFKGKRINVIIGSQPGGGTDGTTRLVGRYLEKYLPGKPRLIYRNMPAGHGVKASNYFANEVKRDGLTWMGGARSYVDATNMSKKVVKYDPTKYEFIGAVSRGGSVVIISKAKLANLTDKSKKPVIVGGLDGSRSWAQLILWGADYLGWNVKFVIGYPGSSALALALRRGEIDMFGTSSLLMHQGLNKTGKFHELVQLGEPGPNGTIIRRLSFKDVPTMPVMMNGKTSGLAKETFESWVKTNQIDKWYALPPGTPKKYVTVYRTAYKEAIKDPEFIKAGKFQFSADFNPVSAADIARLVRDTAYPRDEIVNFQRQMKVRHGLPATKLSDKEMAAMAAKRGIKLLKVTVKLEAVKRGGRWLHFTVKGKKHKAKVSGSRTKVKIAGKKAKRKKLKAGMKCNISYLGNGAEARLVDCKQVAIN